MEKKRQLEGKGEFDYDYKYDILHFKVSEREYFKSIELENLILDIDKERFIAGIRILEASKFFNLSKSKLLKIPEWNLRVDVEEGRIEVRLIFKVVFRNKVIEKNPIIMQRINESLPNSLCEVSC